MSAASALVAVSLVGPAQSATLFTDTFEGTLSQWSNPASAGQIVTAPDGLSALTFNILQAGSNVLTTTSAFTSSTGHFTLSFDIFANCGHTSQCGAYFRANGAPGASDGWILTDSSFNGIGQFPDAPYWENVTYSFAGTTITLGIEDSTSTYAAPYPSANAIYIRNLSLTNNPTGIADGTVTVTALQTAVPEPASITLLATGILATGFVARRRRGKGDIGTRRLAA